VRVPDPDERKVHVDLDAVEEAVLDYEIVGVLAKVGIGGILENVELVCVFEMSWPRG
jgi:hypothetical protein